MGKLSRFKERLTKFGRAALIDAGRKTLHVCCPSYPAPMAETVGKLLETLHNFGNLGMPIDVALDMPSSALIHVSRNEAARKTIDDDDSMGLLFVDSDMRWPSSDARVSDGENVAGFNAVQRLIARDKDIISGLYTSRNMPTVLNAGFFGQEGELVRLDDDRAHPLNGTPFKVDWTGMGFCFISRRALITLAELCNGHQHLFEPESKAFDRPGTRGMLKQLMSESAGMTFDEFEEELKRIWRTATTYSEDLSFCRRAKEAGIELWIDPSFELQHLGTYPYTRLDWVGQKMARAQAPPKEEED